MTNPLYEVRNISKRYGSVVALDGADFQINAGEIVGLVGDNGAGKSTLVKCLSGAHKPTSGQIFLDGKEVTWDSPRDAIEAGVETLYQDSGLAPHLTVGANVFLGREKYQRGILGKFGFLDNKAMNKEAHEDLERVGIAVPASSRSISQLSGGQRQAVAIGRAVSWASKVIILDEPTAALGVRESNQVLKLIERLRDRGLPVILISHNMPQVFEVADRIQVQRLGKRAGVVTPKTHQMNEVVAIMTGALKVEEKDQTLQPVR